MRKLKFSFKFPEKKPDIAKMQENASIFDKIETVRLFSQEFSASLRERQQFLAGKLVFSAVSRNFLNNF